MRKILRICCLLQPQISYQLSVIRVLSLPYIIRIIKSSSPRITGYQWSIVKWEKHSHIYMLQNLQRYPIIGLTISVHMQQGGTNKRSIENELGVLTTFQWTYHYLNSNCLSFGFSRSFCLVRWKHFWYSSLSLMHSFNLPDNTSLKTGIRCIDGSWQNTALHSNRT